MNGLQVLCDLSAREAETLRHLVQGPMATHWSEYYMLQAFGRERGTTILHALNECDVMHFTREQIVAIIDACSIFRNSDSDWFSWVITGLTSTALPRRDTAVLFRSLIQQAKNEVIITTYAIHKGKSLLAELHEKMVVIPGFKTILVCDVRREYHDRSLDEGIIARFKRDFCKKHWPWHPLPEIYYYPQALSMEPEERAVLHAKCMIVDGERAFVGSANLTEAAHERNIEVGTMVSNQKHALSLRKYFMELIEIGKLCKLN